VPESGGDDRMEFLIVGRVRRPHGVRGEVLISVDTDRPGQVFRPERTLHLGTEQARAGQGSVIVESMRPTTGGAILKLRGITRREETDPLRGRVLLIPAGEAEPAAEGEVHQRDLIGMTAVSNGEALGTVDDLLELNAVELLLVRGRAGKEILIPFVRDLVRSIDLEARVVNLELPEGFLEI